MLTRDEKLIIFENFVVDTNLPKFRKIESSNADGVVESDRFGAMTLSGISPNGSSRNKTEDLFYYSEYILQNEFRFFHKLKWRIFRFLIGKPKEDKEQFTTKGIKEFFNNIKNSSLELNVDIDEIAENYEKTLTLAKRNNQTALVEKMLDNIESFRNESFLMGYGITKYVTEQQVVDFFKKASSNKLLSLVWMKNFTRVIPEDVTLLKEKVDEYKIFDNYVILNFDPNGTSFEMTKREKEKAKDPILFGVLKNSRKLYFIADWTDEYCDLTLDKMLETIKEPVGEINKETINNYLSVKIK